MSLATFNYERVKNLYSKDIERGNIIFIMRKLRDEENWTICDVIWEPFYKCKWEGEYLWGNSHMGKITVKHGTVIKYIFEEFLKGAKKPFRYTQETKMRGAHEENTFQSNDEELEKRSRAHDNFNKLLLFSRFVVLLQIVVTCTCLYLNRYEMKMRMSQWVSMVNRWQVLLTKVFLNFSQF